MRVYEIAIACNLPHSARVKGMFADLGVTVLSPSTWIEPVLAATFIARYAR